ncbi:MAG: type II CRISPR-associated endonuclease Cas1 [Phycisphaerae bacterium]
MIKRTVEISTDGSYLAVRNDQLVIKREREVVGTVPCEDIGLLIIDSKATVYTHDALVRAAQYGAIVVLCGEDHHPAAMVLPTAANTVQTQRLRLQATAKLPRLKRMWQQIVRAKIRRQAAVLSDKDPARTALEALVSKVRSGDPENVEARASRKYWPALFGDPNFRRKRKGPPPNNLLNYGYMALRAAVARAVCGAGLHPSLGISHHNKYNPFCLADDLMEPYRPFVDARVVRLWREGQKAIDRDTKRDLLEILTDPVTVGESTGPLMVALHKTAASVVKCLSGEEERLALP